MLKEGIMKRSMSLGTVHKWAIFVPQYSRTSLMWTGKGQTKSVHNSEVSTLVKLGVATATDLTDSLPWAPWCILRLGGAYCAFLVHKYPI